MKLVGWALPRLARMALAFVFAAILGGNAYAQSGDVYRMGPGDILEVSVLEDPDLGRQVLVRPDGRISMPIAGTLMAEGRTPEQLQASIRSRLARNFVEPPSVTVALVSVAQEDDVLQEEEEIENFAVYVVGEVGRPGRYEYPSDEPVTILQALTLAGGTGPFAAIKRIQVREVVDSVETVRFFNYELVQQGASINSADDSALTDGAILIVPERGFFE